MQKESRTSIIVSAAIFIILEFAALAMLSNSSSIQSIWLSRISHRTMAAIWGGGEKIKSYFLLSSINEDLSEENALLREELRNYKVIEERNREVSAAVPVADDRFKFTPATIVKMSHNSAHNYIILNKGSEDGIRTRSGIISNEGVVGLITSVDKNYSYGISFLNSDMKVSCFVGNSNIRAMMSWQGLGSNKALLHDIPAHSIVNVGDTVKTSGFSSIFPADIVLGVAKESRLVDGNSMEVKVDLFQDFNTLRYVTIIENTAEDIIKTLEEENE